MAGEKLESGGRAGGIERAGGERGEWRREKGWGREEVMEPGQPRSAKKGPWGERGHPKDTKTKTYPLTIDRSPQERPIACRNPIALERIEDPNPTPTTTPSTPKAPDLAERTP